MSLNWNFKTDKIGTWKEKRHYQNGEIQDSPTFNLYSGNALAIMCYEYKEEDKNMYQVCGFFCDKDHMKNCLGLTKGYENMYKTAELEVTLYQEYRHTPEMVKMLSKADFDFPIKITIIPKAP